MMWLQDFTFYNGLFTQDSATLLRIRSIHSPIKLIAILRRSAGMQISIRAFFVLGLALVGLLVLTPGRGSSGNANIRFVTVTPHEFSLDFLVNGASLATGVSYG